MKLFRRKLAMLSCAVLALAAAPVYAGEAEDALRAYASFAEQYGGSFAIDDVNGDGIQEICLDTDGNYGFYTWYNGRVQDVGFSGKMGIEEAWPATGLLRFYRQYKDGSEWTIYYVLRDGALQVVAEDFGNQEYCGSNSDVRISESEFRSILGQYMTGSSFKPFTNSYLNTAENRNSILLSGGSSSGGNETGAVKMGGSDAVKMGGSYADGSGTSGTGYAVDNSGFLLPFSSSRYINDADIAGFTKQELCYARNEIAARHGRMFNSAELTAYFNTRSWYNPTMDPATYTARLPGLLNDYENVNSEFILSREKDASHPNGYDLDQPGYDITKVRSFYAAQAGGAQGGAPQGGGAVG